MAKDIIYEVSGLVPEKVKLSLRAELKISEDIDAEVDTAAITFGYYAILAEKADTRYQKMKFAYDAWQASTEAKVMLQRSTESKKAFTEAQMKAHVRSQPKYVAYQRRLIDFDEHRRILKVIAKAFEMKKDLVQTKAANRRGEGKGSLAK